MNKLSILGYDFSTKKIEIQLGIWAKILSCFYITYLKGQNYILRKAKTKMNRHVYLRLLWVSGRGRAWLSKILKWCSLSHSRLTLVCVLIIFSWTLSWLVHGLGISSSLSSLSSFKVFTFLEKIFYL